MNVVCVFCGSSPGNDPACAASARTLGRTLAERGTALVYGGLKGVVTNAALGAGGEVAGVMPKSLVDCEIGHTGLTKLHGVRSMHKRRAMMSELSTGFVALPDGNGTLEGFFEVLTWVQLGEHAKPCELLKVPGYYDPLLTVLEQMVGRTFLKREHRKLVLVEEDPSALLERFEAYESRRGPSSGPTTRRDEP